MTSYYQLKYQDRACDILLLLPPPSGFGTDTFFQPLGFGYIAAAARLSGYSVHICDLTVDREARKALPEILASSKAMVVGLTAVTPTIEQVWELFPLVREYLPEARIVVGGPHASVLPEETLEHGADAVVIGEGEQSFIDLLHAFETKATEPPPGIIWKRNDVITAGEKRRFIEDLDDLPFPARDLFPPLHLYKGTQAYGNRLPIANIIASRGCPYSCKFCYKPFGNRIRFRSAENIYEEWVTLVRDFNVREITFSDDGLTTRREIVEELCERIIDGDHHVPWTCSQGVRADSLDSSLIKLMKKAGLYRLAFGIESGSEEVLEKMGKRLDLADVETAVSLLKKEGIETIGFFLLGMPWDTEESMKQTISYARQSGVDYARFTIAIPFPGTPMLDEILADGKMLIEHYRDYNIYGARAMFEMPHLSADIVERAYKKAFRSFYFRPKRIIEELLKPNVWLRLPQVVATSLKMLKGPTT